MAKNNPKPPPGPDDDLPAKPTAPTPAPPTKPDPYDTWNARLRNLFLFGLGSWGIITQFRADAPNVTIIGACFILCGLPYFIGKDDKEHRGGGR